MHMNTVKQTTEDFDGETELPDLQQGSLIFKADVNCQIGSRYIMGVGCEEGIFLNAHKISPSVRPIKKVELNSYKVTSCNLFFLFL